MAWGSETKQDDVPFGGLGTSRSYMILPLITAQDAPLIERHLKPKAILEYRVELTTIANQLARYDYTMRGTVGGTQGDGEFPVQFILEKMKGEIEGMAISSERFGSMQTRFGPKGFPRGLSFVGSALSFSMPLLSFYLPEKTGAVVEFASESYDGRISVVGKAVVKGLRVESQAKMVVSEEEPDQSMFRKLKMTAEFDKNGVLLTSQGKYTAPDGTVNFKLTQLSASTGHRK
jgi:hypothetical protein